MMGYMTNPAGLDAVSRTQEIARQRRQAEHLLVGLLRTKGRLLLTTSPLAWKVG